MLFRYFRPHSFIIIDTVSLLIYFFLHQVFFIVEIIFHLQSPETQKFKLKVLGDEFEAERNEKTLKLKPKVIGCIWTNEHGTLPESSKSHFYIFYQHD